MEANGIVLSPDPRLRQECAVIEEITPAIEALAEKMKKMMFENGGCGLAAPQIGELIQLVTIELRTPAPIPNIAWNANMMATRATLQSMWLCENF